MLTSQKVLVTNFEHVSISSQLRFPTIPPPRPRKPPCRKYINGVVQHKLQLIFSSRPYATRMIYVFAVYA